MILPKARYLALKRAERKELRQTQNELIKRINEKLASSPALGVPEVNTDIRNDFNTLIDVLKKYGSTVDALDLAHRRYC